MNGLLAIWLDPLHGFVTMSNKVLEDLGQFHATPLTRGGASIV